MNIWNSKKEIEEHKQYRSQIGLLTLSSPAIMTI